MFDGVYWNVRCVFINVSIDSAFLRGDYICFASVRVAVHICVVLVCIQYKRFCVMYKCGTHKPKDTH